MRRTVAPACLLLLLATAMAGCSGGAEEPVADDFQDIDVDATSTTGIILGVVVDEAIRPIQGVTVTIAKPDGSEATQETDAQGRFAFGNLQPGSYLIRTSHPQFTSAQSTAEVQAGVDDPPVVRILVERLFSQDPFSEIIKFDGYLACAYAVGVSSTCVNDYTRIVGERCTPSPAPPVCTSQCAGGCLRDYNISQQGGNIREYVTPVGPGWQVLVFEAVWEPTLAGTADELGVTVSYFGRFDASHSFAGESETSPMHFTIEVDEEAELLDDGQPANIPPMGIEDLFVFFSAGSGSTVPVAINQPFQSFQVNFYYGIPPEGWSFVSGDELPF